MSNNKPKFRKVTKQDIQSIVEKGMGDFSQITIVKSKPIKGQLKTDGENWFKDGEKIVSRKMEFSFKSKTIPEEIVKNLKSEYGFLLPDENIGVEGLIINLYKKVKKLESKIKKQNAK